MFGSGISWHQSRALDELFKLVPRLGQGVLGMPNCIFLPLASGQSAKTWLPMSGSGISWHQSTAFDELFNLVPRLWQGVLGMPNGIFLTKLNYSLGWHQVNRPKLGCQCSELEYLGTNRELSTSSSSWYQDCGKGFLECQIAFFCFWHQVNRP